MPERFSIKQWSEDDRPREKLLKHGASTLSDAELLAILLGSGNREYSAVDLAKQILNSADNNLDKFAGFEYNDLVKFNGIGTAKAVTLLAAFELGRRRKFAMIHKKKIVSPEDAYVYMFPVFADLNIEEFWVLLLNSAMRVIGKYKIGQGGFSSISLDLKVLFKKVLENNAKAMVLCHNHPSGYLKPSDEDKILTKMIVDAANILNIDVVDHLIISNHGFYSFKDDGKI